jgi:hypothetical protein
MCSPPTWWKFKYMNRPRKKRSQQGSCSILASNQNLGNNTHFSKLPPVEKMAGIIFENENIIDLGLMPDTTCETEE